ncbi:MAG TPA: peptidoglycan DD-metalloendopeptidase family protein [Actinomycetota bacterium]|nr:peptidoglycan DD-metalloendopeptidase family protein [Actinomycetota bacterium]
MSQPGVQAQSIREKLEAARKQLKAIERRLDGIVAQQRALQNEVTSLTTQIAQAYAQKQVIQGHIQETNGEVTETEQEVDVLQRRLNDRARDAYIRGPADVVEVVLEADSLVDLSDRVAFIDVLNQADAALATGVDRERQHLEEFKADLVGLRKEQQRLLKKLRRQTRRLQNRQRALAGVKESIEAEKVKAKKVVEELEIKWQRELLARIAKQTGGTVPPNIDGKPGPFYACPVDAPRSYINDFGYPRSGGRTHQGNDIFAPRGTPIRAPFDGRAEEGSNGLGGLSVHVYGAQGYVYNAHLSRYAGVSGHVNAGDIIGYVGDTGNARGTSPHDHFEWHPGGGSAITPYHYLNEVCGVNGG